MTKEPVKPIVTPDFVNELIEKIKEAVKVLNPEFELVVTHPDFNKTVGVQGNHLESVISSNKPFVTLVSNSIRIRHCLHQFFKSVTVIFDRAPSSEIPGGKVYTWRYIPDTEMIELEEMVYHGENQKPMILASRISALPSEVARFMVSDKMPTDK